MKIQIVTENQENTILVAEKFAKSLFAPCVVALEGDLGAGKTTFAKGVARSLGIKEPITSPTFTIMNEYQGTKTKLFHFDLYRLEDPEEFHAMGFEEYFDLTTLDGISLVEWPSNCPNILPERRFDVKITKQGENKRLIEISPRGLV